MYRIALCDDETAELDKTEKMLEDYLKNRPDKELIIERFENAEELLYLVGEKNYTPDIILMDIYMPRKLGTDAARELRAMGNNCKIIFLTTSREHALEAFGVDAAQYLVKPVEPAAFYSVIDRFLEDIGLERKKFLLFRIDGKIKRISLNDIVFCEARGKKQYLHLLCGEKPLLHLTMTELFTMLSPYSEFVRVGVAYIVNLRHINSMNARELSLDGGGKVHLPRGAYKILKEQYFRYYCEI